MQFLSSRNNCFASYYIQPIKSYWGYMKVFSPVVVYYFNSIVLLVQIWVNSTHKLSSGVNKPPQYHELNCCTSRIDNKVVKNQNKLLYYRYMQSCIFWLAI